MSGTKRFTYANVVSTLALVLAMSGTAYAVATVTSGDIVNKTIKVKDISDAAVFDLLPEVGYGFKNDAGAFSGSSDQTVATVNVPDDTNAVVIAKMRVNNLGGAVTVLCRLSGGASEDVNFATLAPSGAPGSTENLTFLLSSFFDPAEDATIVCNPNGGSIHLFDLKITAIQTSFVVETPL